MPNKNIQTNFFLCFPSFSILSSLLFCMLLNDAIVCSGTARSLWWNRSTEFVLMWVQHEKPKPQLSGKQKTFTLLEFLYRCIQPQWAAFEIYSLSHSKYNFCIRSCHVTRTLLKSFCHFRLNGAIHNKRTPIILSCGDRRVIVSLNFVRFTK